MKLFYTHSVLCEAIYEAMLNSMHPPPPSDFDFLDFDGGVDLFNFVCQDILDVAPKPNPLTFKNNAVCLSIII